MINVILLMFLLMCMTINNLESKIILNLILIRAQSTGGLTVERTDIKRRKQAGGGTCVYRDCLLLSIQ